MKNLQKLVSTKNFDTIKNALDAYTELFNRFYEDTKRRMLIEKKIRASWVNIPISVRINLLIKLANFSLANNDKIKALELANEAQEVIDSVNWQLRFKIPLMSRLAELRFRTGDTDQAKAELQDALNMFDTNREKIVNIYRAQLIVSIAEVFHTMGDAALAVDLYKRAIEAGIENPNSRPRAEDLTATCCSLALNAVKPDEVLLKRIREIYKNLGDPW
jgi:tetratricopeptide (TPR) repeat protein